MGNSLELSFSLLSLYVVIRYISRPLFIYFRLFNTADNKQMFNKILPMTGVEPRTSGIESDRSTNWASTTSLFRCSNYDSIFVSEMRGNWSRNYLVSESQGAPK